MSGHSKWHNIQERKGKQDAKRSNIFTKIAKMITIAAQKGADPTMNFTLRLALEKAKAAGMPKDNIDRAIKRGTGETGETIVMEEAMYEAFAPGGVAIMIKVVTDNRNRTAPEIKHILSLNNCSLAGQGSVQWMFGHWGVVVVAAEKLVEAKINRDDFDLEMIDNGAEDIAEEDGEVVLKARPENLQRLLLRLKEMNIEPKESGLRWVAKEKLAVDDTMRAQLEKLFGDLEENDDVEDYYTNAV